MITKFVNIKYVFSKIYRDLGINYELDESAMIEWAAEALSMIGAYSQFEEISHCLPLVRGKAKLPCGFEKLVDINYNNKPVFWATNTNAHNYQCTGCQIPVCDSCGYNFYINDNYLISNINTDTEANICIVYLGIRVDEDGYPLVPDNVYYFKALTAYITMMLDKQEWRKGKLPDKVWQDSERDWLFYVNSARGAANMPNTAQLENLKNIWKRLMPTPNEYGKGFSNFNKQERLNRR